MSWSEPHIDFVNASTVVTDDEAKKVMAALRTQADKHYRPIWGMGCALRFTKKPNPQNWQLIVLDNSDQAGALGYHDLTPDGKALGKIFAATDRQYGLAWSVTASHELLEMLGDPYICLTAEVTNGVFYAYENCDACEADEFGYNIDGVTVSDFVYPTWFLPNAHGPYDYGNHIKNPLELLKGGYISLWTSTGGWTQQTNWQGVTNPALTRPVVGTRRERRRISRQEWILSEENGA